MGKIQILIIFVYMPFRITAPDIFNWPAPEPLGDDKGISESQMAEASDKYLEALNIPLPTSLLWQGNENGKFIRFIGNSRTGGARVINPDPSITGTRGGSNEITNTNQILAELYLPAGYTLKATPSTNSITGAAGNGIPQINHYSKTSYYFDLLDNAGISVPYASLVRAPVNRLNNYGASGITLIAYHYSIEYSWWFDLKGNECEVACAAFNIYRITEEPVIFPDPFPLSPDPPSFPNAPPPCDVKIGVDSSDEYFCMTFAEYQNYIAQNRRANEGLDLSINLLRRFP
ncbi:hypothetical protein [Argonema antarcticum]|uniref:hypothetical protein n=1 Tax=Argonema antarcticum TaxID=2942763 RepID=UPI00201272F4|nr:hypothetical protein [Argonema antarcticum]MCL1474428.1 hypothetical protein [Argonema antarcticum A004/B2]